MKLNDLPQQLIGDVLSLVAEPLAFFAVSTGELAQAARTARVCTRWTHRVIRRKTVALVPSLRSAYEPQWVTAFRNPVSVFISSLFAGRLYYDHSVQFGPALGLVHPFSDVFTEHVVRAARHSDLSGNPLAAQLDAYLAATHDVVASPVRFTLLPCGLLLAIFFLYTGDHARMQSLLDALIAADPTVLTLKRPLAHWTRIHIDERVHVTLLVNSPPADNSAHHVTFLAYLAILALIEWDVSALDVLVQPPYSVDVAQCVQQAWCDHSTIMARSGGHDEPEAALARLTCGLEWLRGRGWVDTGLLVIQACAYWDVHPLVKALVHGYYATIPRGDPEKRVLVADSMVPQHLEGHDLELLAAAVRVGFVSDDMWAALLSELGDDDDDVWRERLGEIALTPGAVQEWDTVLTSAMLDGTRTRSKTAHLLRLAGAASSLSSSLRFITYEMLESATDSGALLPAFNLLHERGVERPSALDLLMHVASMPWPTEPDKVNSMTLSLAYLLSFALNDERTMEPTLAFLADKDVNAYLQHLDFLDQRANSPYAHHVLGEVRVHPRAMSGSKPWHVAAKLIRERYPART
ncbi:hypothetical protein H9P43_008836 [Blastocladiella emersonii ATCC 22665]|nr:hypothetical protein H9P43_008836 [Blastocladiella emersonii ATCC 22665]